MSWLHVAQPLPVTYHSQQTSMRTPVLGIVLHTTNSMTRSLRGQQADWQGIGRQSAHFAIDRDGSIGQYRDTASVAWHIGKLSDRYFGIEHVARHKETLTDAQIESSAQLVALLCDKSQIPFDRMQTVGGSGIAIHAQFSGTGCGEAVFWTSTGQAPSTIDEIVRRAKTYSAYGLYDFAERTDVSAKDGSKVS